MNHKFSSYKYVSQIIRRIYFSPNARNIGIYVKMYCGYLLSKKIRSFLVQWNNIKQMVIFNVILNLHKK